MLSLPEQDDRLMSLCELALSLPAAEREVCLRTATAGDADLFEEVWNRVQWEERLGDFLLEPLIPPREQDHPLTPGQVLADRFEIVREVAEGGMAVVYEAMDRKLDQRVAIKCPKNMFRRRLPPEARNALQVSHPNICRVYEIHTAFTDRGEIEFLTMEFLEGETLADRLRREEKLPLEEVRSLARQICAGLEEAHRKGIVHGDLKTSNIILVKTESGVRAVITDFGLAKQITGSGAPLIRSTQLRGTPDFVAPELWQGSPVSIASDLYAVGVILYEALSGVRPWAGEPLQARFAGTPKGPAAIAHDVPAKWSRVVLRCLDREPARRPAGAAAVIEAVEEKGTAPKVWLAVAAVLILSLLALLLMFRPVPPSAPARPIRLALLPFDADAASKGFASGVMVDVYNRLAQVRRSSGLVVLPESDAASNRVVDNKTALAAFGATHTLQVSFRKSGEKLRASAAVWNTETKVQVGGLAAEYAPNELAALPKALLGTVTAALQLRAASAPEQVQPAAYADYAQGLYYLRREAHTADEAIPFFQRAAQLDPHSALPYAGIAEAQLLRFQTSQDRAWLEAAEESLKSAEARNPDTAEVRLVAGTIKQADGRLQQALEDFRRAVEREPANPDALRRLGGAYQALRMPNDAIQTYRQAILVLPGYHRPHSDLAGFYYASGQYADALAEFQIACKLAPGLSQTHLNAGAAYVKLGRYQEAEPEMREALRLRETPDTLAALGALLAYLRRFAESADFYERAVKLGPPTYVVVTNLGEGYRRIGRAGDARRAYQWALQISDQQLIHAPLDARARALAGYLSARLGDRARAQREIEQALHLAPDDAYVVRSAILTYEVLKDRDASIRLLERVPQVADDLSRQPDLAELQGDPRFHNLVPRLK